MIGNPGRKSHVVYGPLRPGPPTSWSLPSPSQPLILTLPHTLPSTHHLRTQMRLIYTFTCDNTPLPLATNSSVPGSVFSNCVQGVWLGHIHTRPFLFLPSQEYVSNRSSHPLRNLPNSSLIHLLFDTRILLAPRLVQLLVLPLHGTSSTLRSSYRLNRNTG
jgi:hypothetical protein